MSRLAKTGLRFEVSVGSLGVCGLLLLSLLAWGAIAVADRLALLLNCLYQARLSLVGLNFGSLEAGA